MTNPNSFLKQEPPKRVQQKLEIPPPSKSIGEEDDFLKGTCPYKGGDEDCEACQ